MWPPKCNMAKRSHLQHTAKCVKYLVFLASLYCLGRSEVTVITEGQGFLLAFPENFPNDCQFTLNLTTVTTSDVSTKFMHANISVPALNVSQLLTLVPGTITGISLRETGFSPDATSDQSRNNIIYLDVTGGKLSVYGSIICDSPSVVQRKFGEFLAIPVEFWGTRYIVMAPLTTICGYTVTVLTSNLVTKVTVALNIRSTKPSGHVHIAGRHVKDTIVLNLQPYTRTEIVAVYTDITGTIFDSDFPIGLLVGPNNEVSLTSAFCNNAQGLFIEQLIPTYAWGTRYYLTDGGASSNVRYKYDIRVVTSIASTTVFYKYLTSYPDLTLKFKMTQLITQAGGIHNFSLSDSFGFEMVGADLPVMVMVWTSPVNGGDGAMSQAVQSRYFPARVVLRFSPEMGQRIYLFTNAACSEDLNTRILKAFGVIASYSSLEYGKLGTEFYITSSTNGKHEFQAVLAANTGIEGCNGISAFIMNDIKNGYDVLAACPVFWSVECTDAEANLHSMNDVVNITRPPLLSRMKPGTEFRLVDLGAEVNFENPKSIQYFDLGQKKCLSIPTTTSGFTSEDPRQLIGVTSSNPERTTDEHSMRSSMSVTDTRDTTLLDTTFTRETEPLSHQTLSSGYSTEAVVTKQGSIERNEFTEPGLSSSYFTDSISEKMGSYITASLTVAETFSVTKSHAWHPHTNGKPRPMDRNGTNSEPTSSATTSQSSGPFISPMGTSLPISGSADDAAVVVKTPVSYCPCVCQHRPKRPNLYDLPAADILKVCVGNLSRHRRSRNSVTDSRPLSVSFGVVGVAVFVCIFLFALLPSFISRKQSRQRRQR